KCIEIDKELVNDARTCTCFECLFIFCRSIWIDYKLKYAIAAAEATIGLAIVLSTYRNRKSTRINQSNILNKLKPYHGKKWIDPMSHSVKIYDTVLGVPNVSEPVLRIIEDCVGCKRCESACLTDFLSVRVYLWHETTRSMGINGPSIGPVLLTGFITTLATLAAWPVTRDSRLFHFLMLAMYNGQIGSFSSRDLLLFFIMWELELIPVYLLLSMWGGKKRLYSATKFILYTAGGSIFLLMGVLGVGLYGSNEPTINFETSVNQSYPVALEIIFYIRFVIAFAVKLIRLVYLDEMGGVAIPMPKIFTMFSSFSMASLALSSMGGFVAEVL
ncbi:hypothetical protein M8C21_024883, partial [Ambrosia artemisiifolia]